MAATRQTAYGRLNKAMPLWRNKVISLTAPAFQQSRRNAGLAGKTLTKENPEESEGTSPAAEFPGSTREAPSLGQATRTPPSTFGPTKAARPPPPHAGR